MDALINVLIGIGGLLVLGLIEKRKPKRAISTLAGKRRSKGGSAEPKVRLTPEQIEAVKMKRRIKQLERKAKVGDITTFEKQELYNLYART